MCDLCVSDTIIVRFSCALVHQLLEVHRIEFCSNLPVCALSCAPRPTLHMAHRFLSILANWIIGLKELCVI